MGLLISKPTTRASDKEQTQKDVIRKRGVLIPPSFAVGTGQQVLLLYPISAHDRLPLTPSIVDYKVATHVGQGLLQDFMTPGMWVSAGDGGNTVRASLPLLNTSTGGSQGQAGQISFTASPLTEMGPRMELKTGTEGPMYLFVTQPIGRDNMCSVMGNANTNGTGYVGGQIGLNFRKYKRPGGVVDQQSFYDNDIAIEEEGIGSEENDKIQVQLGSWLPLSWNNSLSNNARSKSRHNNKYDIVHGYLSIGMLGSTTCLETKWNRDTYETEVKKYFSMRLNGGQDDDNSLPGTPMAAATSSSPPLWLTMTSTPQASTINVSQILTFDRFHFNLADDRAPAVRNTLGWSVQVERPNGGDNEAPYNSSPSSSTSSSSQISAAMVWQCNRGLALKVVGTSQPQQQKYSCTYGVLLKRWKQPRITCSILNRFDFSTKKNSFLGVGIELETDASALLSPSRGADYYYRDGRLHVPSDVPETKAALP